ncbi:MAG TPA: hypothetical protein VGD67_11365 [Pseudonocardiaceae bacterium]
MSWPALRRAGVTVVATVVATAGLVLVPAPGAANAAVETFHRFEVNAVANYTVAQDCGDGRTALLRVQVIGGHEEETRDGVRTLDQDFVNVLIRGTDCAGVVRNDRGAGPATFDVSPALRDASLAGTVVTGTGRTVTVDLAWTGVGDLVIDHRVTQRPGFVGLFENTRRDATATGTVVVDGGTLVDGTTDNAELETLEDRNVSYPA